MANVQVITDSTSDIPPEMAEKLGIKIIPIYVRFGDKVYRDGVNLTSDDFYRMLKTSPQHPATSQPTPEDFESVYKEYCGKVDGIISIHISSKISGTYNSANIARKMLGSSCPIEVIDSQFNSGGLALVAMAAAKLAKASENLTNITEEIRRVIKRVRMLGMFDTMKYLARSGRVPRAIVAAANILNVKPLLTFREGEIIRSGLVRSFTRGAEKLYKFVEDSKNIVEMVIVHSNIPDKAAEFREQMGRFIPVKDIKILELGPGLGVHGGPGVLLVALQQSEFGLNLK
jgi:DegV family protein with EDD domain